MKKVIKFVDSANEWIGERLKWLVFALIAIVCVEVVMRYVFNHPTIQLPPIITFTGAALYAFAFGYVHLHKGHVRVDVFYAKFPRRVQAIVDSILWFVFFLPGVGYLTYAAWNWVIFSWETNEKSMMTFWFPILGPIRTLVFIGLVFFLLQGVVTLIRDLHLAIRSEPYD